MNTATARARFLSDGMATLSGPKLLVALYRRLVRDLDDAVAFIESANPSAAHDALVHAQEIVYELTLALDANTWEGAGQLAEIYEWLYHRLVAANIAKDAAIVNACRDVVVPLCDAWTEASTGGATIEVPTPAEAAV